MWSGGEGEKGNRGKSNYNKMQTIRGKQTSFDILVAKRQAVHVCVFLLSEIRTTCKLPRLFQRHQENPKSEKKITKKWLH